MPMTRSEIDDVVAARGSDKLIGFVFDSGTRETFENYDPDFIFALGDNVMQFKHKDIGSVPYVTVVPCNVVVGMLFVEDVNDKKKINVRSALF